MLRVAVLVLPHKPTQTNYNTMVRKSDVFLLQNKACRFRASTIISESLLFVVIDSKN